MLVYKEQFLIDDYVKEENVIIYMMYIIFKLWPFLGFLNNYIVILKESNLRFSKSCYYVGKI